MVIHFFLFLFHYFPIPLFPQESHSVMAVNNEKSFGFTADLYAIYMDNVKVCRESSVHMYMMQPDVLYSVNDDSEGKVQGIAFQKSKLQSSIIV